MRALTIVPALILVVSAVFLGVAGLGSVGFGISGLRGSTPILWVGVALIGAALVHMVVGTGVWLRRTWAAVAGLIVCSLGLVFAAYLGQRALTPEGSHRNDAGIMQTDYGTSWAAVGIVAIPYAVAFVYLLADRLWGREESA